MVYLLLDNRKLAFALVYEKPTGDIKYIEMETEEEALKYLGKIWTGTEFIELLTEEFNIWTLSIVALCLIKPANAPIYASVLLIFAFSIVKFLTFAFSTVPNNPP